MNSGRILIIEDDEGMRFFLTETLAKEGYDHRPVASGEEALKLARKEKFDVVIIDYNLPKMNGLETFRRLREGNPNMEAIMITAFGSRDLAITAMNEGILDFFNKPLDVAEIRVVIHRALERCQLKTEIQSLRHQLDETQGMERILGGSRAVQNVVERVRKVAQSNVAVLILGESGTGKELVAQALHYTSPRWRGPFVKVNCAAVPQELLEAEFFGYEKGAFTGAVKTRRGKFEQAHGGTLFLDEIGDMPLTTQMKILRAIQENEIEHVGGEDPIKIDIRLLAATNKDLEKAVAEGTFREDLFYRLNVVCIPIPPLRERPEDIPILANHFLRLYNEKFKKGIESVSPEGMELLQSYSWPGNIRELENVIQRGIVLAYNDVVGKKELIDVYPPLADNVPETAGPKLQDQVDAVASLTEKRLILEALKEENWKRQETADRLGISRKSLHNKMKKYGLER
ncbi:MAG: hypothetical protein COV67_14120 [Nitrospinae bacterium CG11_big_fil_rev_8_21_14_0_20_56_8]|nr:MAG: hypothetical protein COV67_14120 [Nitrospinae bacterium CG11_big_fil_rev_8_21_14_0_20_56_8]